MAFLDYLEASAFSEWLSISMAGFPTLIALHSVGMAVVVGLSLMVTLRLYEVFAGFSVRQIPRLLNVAAWGFLLNLVTGLALFITRGSEYISSYIFIVKILLVLVSAAMLFSLRQRLRPMTSTATVSVTDRVARTMALASTVTWFAAVVAGRLIAYLSDLYR